MPYDPSTLRMSDRSLFLGVANDDLVDLSDEEDLWQPPHLLETDKLYPETKCHSTLTFMHFCNLAQVCCLGVLDRAGTNDLNPDHQRELQCRIQ